MAHVAHQLGADPITVRRLNFLKTYPFPVPAIGAAAGPCAAAPSGGSGASHAGAEAAGQQRVPGGCGRLNGWNAVAQQPRMMSTSLGR